MRPRATRGVLALLMMTAPVRIGAQTPVTAERPITGGSVFASDLVGVELRVPEMFTGSWDDDARGIVLRSADGLILGVWGWSEGTVEEVSSVLEERLAGLGLRLSPRGDVEVTDDALTGSFDAMSAEGRGVMHASIRRGDEGNVFAVAVLGPEERAGDARSARDAVIGSLVLGTPGAAAWRAEVEGAVLTWTSSGSDVSGGTTTATGASSSRATLALCGGGRYRYAESSESYVSIEGMSASSESSGGHAGAWWITADLAGQATLTLETDDGRVLYWDVEESGDAYLVDGYAYRLTGSC